MTPSYAIVAIASEDDYVWRLSSEKKPHITLLYLGDHLDHIDRVEEFIAHAVDTSMHKFGMDVKKRGPLGPDSADVLFFGDYSRKTLDLFRTYLLQNSDISLAYNSTTQFPEWVPHLTMGHPDTPAKPDTRDYPGTTWVNFDKIALWTGDSEGVEFPLKDNNDLAMSLSRGGNFLEHFGVKGMHWGVRKAKDLAASPTGKVARKAAKIAGSSEDHRQAQTVKLKAKHLGVNTLTNQDLQKVITRMNLETQYKTLKQVEFEQSTLGKGKKWAGDFVTGVAKDAAASWLGPRRRAGGSSTFHPSSTAYSWGKQVGEVLDSPTRRRELSS